MNWDHIEVLVTSILTFLTAGIGFAYLFKKVKNVHDQVQDVHVLVNSNLSAVMKRLGIEQDRSTQLTDALKEADVKVPPKPENDKGLALDDNSTG
jgi:hypothetical protein